MDGLLVIDKPAGPTSHDVVARVRRILRERSVGHTGTLDPAATGVLPLVVGRATRLARFLSVSDKAYDAVIRFGFATDTGDASGVVIGDGDRQGDPGLPTRAQIEGALDHFRGTFLQQPPAFSAKKIGGTRSYAIARRQRANCNVPDTLQVGGVGPSPVSVCVHRLEIVDLHGDLLTLTMECSAGFYVRSLAHDLGVRLGIGAHLTSLRRTRSGDVTLDDAIPLAAAEADPARAAAFLVPPARMLAGLPSIVLTENGVRRAAHGHDIGPGDVAAGGPTFDEGQVFVRLLSPSGDLVAMAQTTASGALHPSVVLV